MADNSNTTKFPRSEGAKLSPIGSAFSGFLGTTWPLIRAERDLSGFCGLGWDPAVDAWIRVMQSGDPAEVADLYHFIVAKQHLFRAERRDAVGNAVNRLLEGSLMRLQIYIKIISRPGPDEDWAVVSGTDISPDEPNASIAEAELEPIS